MPLRKSVVGLRGAGLLATEEKGVHRKEQIFLKDKDEMHQKAHRIV
jgi:hypothetical protein